MLNKRQMAERLFVFCFFRTRPRNTLLVIPVRTILKS